MLVESPEKNARSPTTSEGPRRGRAILFVGVAGACVLGVGAGLWARPALHERQAAGFAPPETVAPAPPTRRKLQIVVNDRLAPPTAPIEVLPAAAPVRAAVPAPFAPAFSEPPDPVRPPEGLIRATAVTPPTPERRPLTTPQAVRAIMPAITGAIAATRHAIARAEAPRPERREAAPAPVRLAKADPPPKPARRPDPAKARAAAAEKAAEKKAVEKAAAARAEKVQLAKAQAARVQLAQLQAAKAQVGKAQSAKAAAHKLELAQAAKAAKAAKAERMLLAQAEARGRAEAREEARQEALADARKRARLAALAHALVRAMPHGARPEPARVEVAQARKHVRKGAHDPKVEQASLKSRRHETVRAAPPHVARARPELAAPQPGSGLMKVSTDPGLGAADRQLSRAYQSARAAGVPDAQLRSQQQRWLAARSAAAREAPWAVRDVYMARIAELNGQAKDARDGY